MSTENSCHFCLAPSSISCDRCQGSFCSKDHLQLLHDQSTGQCFPVRVEHSAEVGNYIVATRDLEPLDLVLEDWAVPSGPQHDTTPVCLTCYVKLSPICQVSCSGCHMPMCSDACAINSIHVDQECKLLQQINFKFNPHDDKSNNIYRSIFILRMLLLSEANSLGWERLNRLMDHKEERLKDSLTWNTFQSEVVNFIKNDLGLASRFSDELINRCVGIVFINGAQASDDNGQMYRCLFPTMAIISSLCTPNCKCIHSESSKTREKGIKVIAQTHISAGEEISIQYNRDYHNLGSRQRRKMYQITWFFDCRCKRCKDPTENGSYLNGFVCPKCHRGIVLSADPLEYNSHWLCGSCNYRMEENEVSNLEANAERIIKTALRSTELEGGLSYVDRCEKLLIEMSQIFYCHHFLVMRIKSQLISQYGNVPGYLYNDMSTEKIRRKIELCKEFVQVFDKIDPGGFTDWWAATTYEQVQAEIYCMHRDIESGSISVDTLKENAKAVEQKLAQVVRILESESSGSYLHKILVKAKKDISSVQELITFADFL